MTTPTPRTDAKTVSVVINGPDPDSHNTVTVNPTKYGPTSPAPLNASWPSGTPSSNESSTTPVFPKTSQPSSERNLTPNERQGYAPHHGLQLREIRSKLRLNL